MKAGTTASKYIVFNELDTEYVDNIIFTFKSIFGSVKKIYPQNVVLEYGRFRIDFTQEDTLAFSPLGTKVEVKCEAQINYKGGAVQKSNCDSWDLESTLATQLIVGNKSDGSESDVIELVLEETVIVIESGGATQSNDYNDLDNKPSINGVELVGDKTLKEFGIEDNIAKYLEENPVSAEVSEEQIATAVDAYMVENPVSAEGTVYYYKPLVIATTANKYWKVDGTLGDSTNETDEYIKKVSATNTDQYVTVTEGETYRVSLGSIGAISTSFNVTQCIFLDDNDTFVAKAFEDVRYKDHVLVTVPTGATRMHFTVWSGGGFTLEKQTIEPYGVINKFEHMTKLNKLQQEGQTFGRKTFAPFDKGYITFVNDDLRNCVSEIVDMFVDKGVPLCLAAPYGNMNNLSTTGTVLDSVKKAVKNGGEVLSHAGAPITETEIDDFDAMYNQFATHKEMLELYGFDVNGIILAGGNGQIVGSQKTDKWARAYYQYSDLYGNSEYGYPYYHYRTALSNCTLDNAKVKIDEAIANKEWVIFYLHDWVDFAQADMEALLDYANSKDRRELGIVTYKQMYDNFCISSPRHVVAITAEKTTTIYKQNSSISTDDITVTAYYNDGVVEKVTTGIAIDLTEINTSVAGDYYASVTYNNKTFYILITIYADGDRIVLYNGTESNGNISWELYNDGVIELTNHVTWKQNIPDYTDGSQPWYEHMDKITKVKLNSGSFNIGTIGKYAFYGATNLTEVDFTDNNPTLSSYSFGNCGFTNPVIKNVYKVDTDVFNGCEFNEITLGSDVLIYNSFGGVNNLSIVRLTNPTMTIDSGAFNANKSTITDIYVPWSEGAVVNAPWGATNATVHYDTVY